MLLVEECQNPPACLLCPLCRLTRDPAASISGRLGEGLNTRQCSEPLDNRSLCIKSVWTKSLLNLSDDLGTMLKKVVYNLCC